MTHLRFLCFTIHHLCHQQMDYYPVSKTAISLSRLWSSELQHLLKSRRRLSIVFAYSCLVDQTWEVYALYCSAWWCATIKYRLFTPRNPSIEWSRHKVESCWMFSLCCDLRSYAQESFDVRWFMFGFAIRTGPCRKWSLQRWLESLVANQRLHILLFKLA